MQPVGAIEQHGPHLPLDTDLVIATDVAEATVAERGDELDAWLLPPLAYSKSERARLGPGHGVAVGVHASWPCSTTSAGAWP